MRVFNILILCVLGFFSSMILPARAFSQISQEEADIINAAAGALERLCKCAQAGYLSRGALWWQYLSWP